MHKPCGATRTLSGQPSPGPTTIQSDAASRSAAWSRSGALDFGRRAQLRQTLAQLDDREVPGMAARSPVLLDAGRAPPARRHGEQARVVEEQRTRSYRIVAQQHVGQRRHDAEVVHDEDPELLVDGDEVGDAGGELVVAGEELEGAALTREAGPRCGEPEAGSK